MRKIIAAINMTVDSICDHSAVTPDEEIHQHYNDLLRAAGMLIYGRVTYQLMEDYWPVIVQKPTGNKPMDDFAVLIENIPKLVFSRTLPDVHWTNTRLKTELIKEEIQELKNQPGKDIVVGSPGLIIAFLKLNLVDELQLCIHPVLAGAGMRLFQNINGGVPLKLLQTKTFGCGAVILYYEPMGFDLNNGND